MFRLVYGVGRVRPLDYFTVKFTKRPHVAYRTRSSCGKYGEGGNRGRRKRTCCLLSDGPHTDRSSNIHQQDKVPPERCTMFAEHKGLGSAGLRHPFSGTSVSQETVPSACDECESFCLYAIAYYYGYTRNL